MADESKNVKISFDNRVNVQLSSQNIAFPGKDFDTEDVTNWIVPSILGRVTRASRRGIRLETWLFQISCFANTGAGGETALKVSEMSDAVITAFNQVDYALQNWAAGGDPTIATLRCSEVDLSPLFYNEPNLLHQACTFNSELAF